MQYFFIFNKKSIALKKWKKYNCIKETLIRNGGLNLKINIEELKKLIKDDFQGNYRLLATKLNVNSSTVYRVLTGRSNPGGKFISNFMSLCKDKNYNFENYIFLN